MSFEIHNPKGKVIHPNDLDQEACDLWLIARDTRHYAHPPLEDKWANSWHAQIGWAIENPLGFEKGWSDVKATMWAMQSKDLYKILYEEDGTHFDYRVKHIKLFLKPYFDLVNYWESRGYIPIKL